MYDVACPKKRLNKIVQIMSIPTFSSVKFKKYSELKKNLFAENQVYFQQFYTDENQKRRFFIKESIYVQMSTESFRAK